VATSSKHCIGIRPALDHAAHFPLAQTLALWSEAEPWMASELRVGELYLLEEPLESGRMTGSM
jgi:hypothetical protein